MGAAPPLPLGVEEASKGKDGQNLWCHAECFADAVKHRVPLYGLSLIWGGAVNGRNSRENP